MKLRIRRFVFETPHGHPEKFFKLRMGTEKSFSRPTQTHTDTHGHTQTHRPTQTHRDTDRYTDTHTLRHTQTLTRTHTSTHTHTHTETQTRRYDLAVLRNIRSRAHTEILQYDLLNSDTGRHR